MQRLATVYKPSLALLTDLYQLTMAYGYWKHGRADRQAVFHLHFRTSPFEGGFSIAAGLADVIEYIQRLRFESEDLDYLRSLTGNDDKPLFDEAFIEYLAR